MTLERVESQRHAAAAPDHLQGARHEVQQHHENAQRGKAPAHKVAEHGAKQSAKHPADGHLDMSDPFAKGDNAKNHAGFPGAEKAAPKTTPETQKTESNPPAGKSPEASASSDPNRDVSSDIRQNYSLRNPVAKQFGPEGSDSMQPTPPADLSNVPMS